MLAASMHNAAHPKVDGTATTPGRVLMAASLEALTAEDGFLLNSNPWSCDVHSHVHTAQDDRSSHFFSECHV